MRRRSQLLLAGLALCMGCDSGSSPVAPGSTLLSASADPTKITLTGTSVIRVVALHPSGVPVRTGTEIRFVTTLGKIDELASTNGQGVAQVTLRADGRAGMATVTATSGVDGSSLQSATTRVEIADAKLVASFTQTASGLTVKFQDTSTGGAPTAWSWDFGDGKTSAERSPLHTYRKAGTYRVELEVSNPDARDTTSQLLRFGAVADFSFTADDLEVTFEDQSSGDPTSWEWKFGDGDSSDRQNPVHTYDAPGEYEVSLKVVTPDSGNDRTRQFVRVERTLMPPTADFMVMKDGLVVTFIDQSTGDPTGWHWDFGDGAGSSERDPVHTYAAEGSYRVTLTASNADGESTKSEVITVSGELTADFTATASGLEVTFEDTSTGEPTSWRWDFGDGAASSLQNPVHIYAATGTYRITLTVANAEEEDTTSQEIGVEGRLEADFSFVVNGLNVDFTDQSRNGPTGWTWDFGDGGMSTSQNPAHTYAAPGGTYFVTLTAKKSNPSEESVITKQVTVP